MKAIIWSKYGDPDGLNIQELNTPSPKANEILVRIHAINITTGDCEMRRLDFPLIFRFALRLFIGLRAPKRLKILGQEFAGEIMQCGANVSSFSVGDRVMGATDFSMGAYAEYICVLTSNLIGQIPSNFNYSQAAALPVGGINAFHFLQQVPMHPGQKVLIIGAGGSIGTIGIQLAKLRGAHVTAIYDTRKLTFLRQVGADEVIDYTQEKYYQQNKKYDVIFDVVGIDPIHRGLKCIEQNGWYILGNPSLRRTLWGKFLTLFRKKHFLSGTAEYRQEDLKQLSTFVEQGALTTYVEKTFSFEKIQEAHRYVESGQKQGNVVLFP